MAESHFPQRYGAWEWQLCLVESCENALSSWRDQTKRPGLRVSPTRSCGNTESHQVYGAMSFEAGLQSRPRFTNAIQTKVLHWQNNETTSTTIRLFGQFIYERRSVYNNHQATLKILQKQSLTAHKIWSHMFSSILSEKENKRPVKSTRYIENLF